MYYVDDVDLGDILSKVLIVILLLLVGSCSYYAWPCTKNLEYVKEHADDKWRSTGFEIQGYDGYNFGSGYGVYGGAEVWYFLKKLPDNGITYAGYLQRWGDEVHTYDVQAIDAIKPQTH